MIQSADDILSSKWYTLRLLQTSQYLPLNAKKLVRHYSFTNLLVFTIAQSFRDLIMLLLLSILCNDWPLDIPRATTVNGGWGVKEASSSERHIIRMTGASIGTHLRVIHITRSLGWGAPGVWGLVVLTSVTTHVCYCLGGWSLQLVYRRAPHRCSWCGDLGRSMGWLRMRDVDIRRWLRVFALRLE